VTTFRSIVEGALKEVDTTPGDADWTVASSEDLAIALTSRLHDAGLAIHALDGRCVRLPAEDLGRPMTDADRALIGGGA
jgi:hypothetical protein